MVRLREVHKTIFCKVITGTSVIAILLSLYLFLFQFVFALDIDLIDNKTLTLHENNVQNPEGACQSDPYKNYIPFRLKLTTKNDVEYDFWCAPYVHYQVFVFCVGWLLNTFILVWGFIQALIFNCETNKILIFSSFVVVGFCCFGVYDIVNWVRMTSFCSEKIPKIEYGEEVINIDCGSKSFLAFAISEVVCSIFMFINNGLISIFYNKNRHSNVFGYVQSKGDYFSPIGSPANFN